MVGPDLEERRVDRRASVEGDRTARMEAAPRGDPRRVRRLATEDDRPPAQGRIRHGHDAQEGLRIRVAWVGEHLAGRAVLDDASEVHDRDAVGVGSHGRQVVGDHHHPDPAVASERPEEVEDVGADADVEHAHRARRR